MKQQLEQLLKDAEEVTAKMREALAQMGKPAINMEHGKWYRSYSGHDWLIKFDRVEDYKVMVLDSFCISTDSHLGVGYHCNVNEIQSYSPATPEDMQLLPDWHPEKPWIPKKGDWVEVVSVDEEDIENGIKVGDILNVDENSLSPFCILPNGKRRSMNAHQLLHLPNYQPNPALAATYEEVVDVVKPEWVCYTSGKIGQTLPDPYKLPTEQAANQHRAFIQIKNLEAYCAAKFEGERDCVVDVNECGGICSYEFPYGIIKVTREAAEWLIVNHPEPFLVFFGVKY